MSDRDDNNNEKKSFRINANTLFIGALLLVVITVFVTFFVADKLYFSGAIYRKSESVSFEDEKLDPYKIAKFQTILDFIEENYCMEYDINDVVEGSIFGAVSALEDPYTRYLLPGELDDYVDYITGTYIGAGFVYIETDAGLLIQSVETNSPAEKAGILKDDIVTHLNGKAVTEYTDAEMDELFSKADTEITVSVIHSDNSMEDVTVTIAKVSKQSVFVTNYDGIMYARITQFDEDTAAEFSVAIEKIQEAGCDGIVIDLRYNGGGYEAQASEIADILLPECLIAYSEDKNGNRLSEIKSDAESVDLPMVLLVNEGTASASELLAGALKDNDAAQIVGQNTYGKALGQTRIDFEDDGSGLVVTVARYFTPSGKCIHGKGIKPDVEVELIDEYKNVQVQDIPFYQDAQLQKAIELLTE